MKLTRLSLTGLATCFVGVFFLALMTTLGCNHQNEQPRQIPRPVKVARLVDQADSVMSFAGDVRARYETILSFRVAGKLLARHVDVGDRVRKGQVLARLDQNDYRLAVQDLRAQLASAVADRDFSRDDVARQVRLSRVSFMTALPFYLQQAFVKVSRPHLQEISPSEFGPFAKTDRFDSADHDLGL